MNTDVNGLPWGVVDALLDHGVTGLSMAINEHFGHALRPWPRAFRWQSPGGRTLLAYNGFIYGVTSDRNMRVPVDLEEARKRVPEWTKLWEGRGYPHPFLMMQITNIRYHDNGSPQAALPDFIRRFNDTDPAVRLRFVTISEFFDRLRSEPEERLPLMRGDWTDWWNFGAGSTAHETAQALEGQRDLDDALGLDAWHPGEESAPPPDTPRHGAAVAGALCRAHLGRRPLDPAPALARNAHAASPEARLCAGRREPRPHASPRRPRAPGGRRRRRGAPAPRLQPASVRGPPVAAAALPAAARRRARTAAAASASRPSCRPDPPRTASSGRT